MKTATGWLKAIVLGFGLLAANVLPAYYYDSVTTAGSVYSNGSVSAPTGTLIEWELHASSSYGSANIWISGGGVSVSDFAGPGQSTYGLANTSSATSVGYTLYVTGGGWPDASTAFIVFEW